MTLDRTEDRHQANLVPKPMQPVCSNDRQMEFFVDETIGLGDFRKPCHKSGIATTLDTYSHVIPSMQEAAAAAFDAMASGTSETCEHNRPRRGPTAQQREAGVRHQDPCFC